MLATVNSLELVYGEVLSIRARLAVVRKDDIDRDPLSISWEYREGHQLILTLLKSPGQIYHDVTIDVLSPEEEGTQCLEGCSDLSVVPVKEHRYHLIHCQWAVELGLLVLFFSKSRGGSS